MIIVALCMFEMCDLQCRQNNAAAVTSRTPRVLSCSLKEKEAFGRISKKSWITFFIFYMYYVLS